MQHTIRTRSFAAVIAALLLAATVVVGVGGSAGAHVQGIDTRAVIKGGGPWGAVGLLKSDVRRCLGDRPVSLWMDMGEEGPPQKVGEDMSDGDGFFLIEENLFAGDYFVRAPAKPLVNDADHEHICRRAVSAKVRL